MERGDKMTVESKQGAGTIPNSERLSIEQQRKILKPFFSNLDLPVFIVSGLPSEITGALIGRHTMAKGSMRRVFLDEFVDADGLIRCLEEEGEEMGQFLNIERARGMLGRSLAEWGHDSLGAATPLVVGFEGVSQLAAKAGEDVRLGSSPIERSSRYGPFGEKENGEYQYLRPPELEGQPYLKGVYESATNQAFDLYVFLQEPVARAYREKYPDEPSGKIKKRVFDSTRVLLTAAAQTNLGAALNGQAAENLIVKLRADPLVENQRLGLLLQGELDRVAPTLSQRVRGEFGDKLIEERISRERRAAGIAREVLPSANPRQEKRGVILTSHDPKGVDKMVAMILYPHARGLSENDILQAVDKLTPEQKVKVIKEYTGERFDRRSKPGRFAEEAVVTLELILRFAEWRDLQRNRILTPYRQTLSPYLGVDVGEDLKEFGFGSLVEQSLDILTQAYGEVSSYSSPQVAQYLVSFGHLMRYRISLNVREAVHIAELRTASGAHTGYAQAAREIAQEVLKVYPELESVFQHVK